MANKLPQALSDFNCVVDGEGYIGVANKVTIPEVAWKTIEKNLTGYAAAFDIRTGRLNKMEAEITVDSFVADNFYDCLLNPESETKPVILRGSLADGAEDIGIKIVLMGVWISGKPTDFELEAEIKNTFKVSITRYSLEIDGNEKFYIDLPTRTIRLNGKDVSPKIKSNLGI